MQRAVSTYFCSFFGLKRTLCTEKNGSLTLRKILSRQTSSDTGSIGDKGYSIDKSKNQWNLRKKQLLQSNGLRYNLDSLLPKKHIQTF